MAATRLSQVRQSKELKTEVQMNHFDHVIFGEDGKTCISTEDLNGCHAVAIISKKAAILGHWAVWAPAHEASAYPTGEQWTSEMINRMMHRFRDLSNSFKNLGPGGIIIYGLIHGKDGDPDFYMDEHVKIIAEEIKKALDIKAKEEPYKVLEMQEPRPLDKGIILIEGNTSGQSPIVWLEHRQLSFP
ncbi:MAG: hypothetical protein Q9171_001820 [Xanthocarpia ochracea]